jgi:hypothetical protein
MGSPGSSLARSHFAEPGKFGTSVGSYFAPAETCTTVIRIFVGKNFS